MKILVLEKSNPTMLDLNMSQQEYWWEHCKEIITNKQYFVFDDNKNKLIRFFFRHCLLVWINYRLALSCLVLSCLVLSCLVLSCLVLSSLVLSCLALRCLVLFELIFYIIACLALFELIISIALYCLALYIIALLALP